MQGEFIRDMIICRIIELYWLDAHGDQTQIPGDTPVVPPQLAEGFHARNPLWFRVTLTTTQTEAKSLHRFPGIF